jgi:hypothetical protein
VSCSTQQVLGHIPQPSGSTIAAHSAVHWVSQQLGIAAHTQSVTPCSSQPMPSPASQQGPGGTGHIPQPRMSTSLTQMSSHSCSQQKVSCAHTQDSISGLGQPGVGCTSQHASGPGLQLPHSSESTAATHSADQVSPQHSGICSHTHSSTCGSLHPGTTPSSQHSPLGGGPPHSPQARRSTLATQPGPHASLQHAGWSAHTQSSIFTSPQPGASPATQQVGPPVSVSEPLLLEPVLVLGSGVVVVPVLVPVTGSPVLVLVLVSPVGSPLGSPVGSPVVVGGCVVSGVLVGVVVLACSPVLLLLPLLLPLSVCEMSSRPQAAATTRDSARDQGRGVNRRCRNNAGRSSAPA